MVDALSHIFDFTKESGVPDQTTNVSLFLLQPMWLRNIFEYFIIGKFPIQYGQEQKKKLALRSLQFFYI